MISFGSRPMSAQCEASTSRLWANSWGVPPTKFQCCAYFAVIRSVRFSPLPPMQIGGGGRCGALRSLYAALCWEEFPPKAGEPLLDRAELDAVCARLLLVPAGADAQLEAAVGHDVQRRGHVGEHRGVPVVDAR